MQTLARTYMIVIKDNDHITTMNEKYDMDETNTSIVNLFSKP